MSCLLQDNKTGSYISNKNNWYRYLYLLALPHKNTKQEIQQNQNHKSKVLDVSPGAGVEVGVGRGKGEGGGVDDVCQSLIFVINIYGLSKVRITNVTGVKQRVQSKLETINIQKNKLFSV